MYIWQYSICMNTIRLSATAARNNFFNLLDQVASGVEVIIEKDKKEIAILAPRKTAFDWKAFRKAAKAAHGILKDYSVEEITPLRNKKAWKRLGTWDKGLYLQDSEPRKKRKIKK